jgi:nicotinamidase/pyrazinamidase
MEPDAALIVVDVQNDFIPGGALAVPDGDAVVPVINRLAARFAEVVLTQDWHPGDQPFGTIEMPCGTQLRWPDHCVMGSEGAAFHPGLAIPHARLILRKGCNRAVDSHSAFLEADRATRTGLDGYLASRGIRRVWLAGLATDFCVAWTALDARRFGLEVTVVEEACRAIDLDGSLARAWTAMEPAGVQRA